MTTNATDGATQPASLEIRTTGTGSVVVLSGNWTLRGLAGMLERVRSALPRRRERPDLNWDLRHVSALDTTGALILWQAWDRALPEDCQMPIRYRRLFDYWIEQDASGLPVAPRPPALAERVVADLAAPARTAVEAGGQGLQLIGNLVLDTGRMLRRPGRAPWRELSATVYVAGARALPITGLVGIMVGIVVAYLSAIQLRNFGADQYIVDMLGFAVIRELGPLIGAIIVAGRSGSSMTAQIGVMRLAQELDAMTALGISIGRRLIWPRVTALIVVMPLLVLWTVLAGLAGGIAASQVTLGLGLEYFLTAMPDRVPTANLWIGLGKGLVFGAAVGLTASYYGLRIKPNTRDLGAQTTRAVVVAVTLVILIDAMFAILLQEVGL